MVQAYGDRMVKDVIAAHPAVGEILERYGIGCGPCTVGTCLLKDVVAIHGLPPEKERALTGEIARVLGAGAQGSPDTPSDAARPAATERATVAAHPSSPAMDLLIGEHRLIRRLLDLVPAIAEALRRGEPDGPAIASSAVAFIRGFADRFHHRKEEDELFVLFDAKADPIRAFVEDHERARAIVRDLAEAVERGDVPCGARCLASYQDLLDDHIRREDEILYPFLERQLSRSQVGELFARFRAIEEDESRGFRDAEEARIARLEDRFGKER